MTRRCGLLHRIRDWRGGRQAEVAKQMGMWLTGSDDALIAHLLERDSAEES